MCKAFFVRHSCKHVSKPRIETCPKKARFGECNGVKRIEVRNPTLCARCKSEMSNTYEPQRHAPSSTTNVLALEPQRTVDDKKVERRNHWMTEPNKPSPKKPQTSLNHDISSVPKKVMPNTTEARALTQADERKAKQVEARARNTTKKRAFQDALEELSGKPATKKHKPSPAKPATALPSLVQTRTLPPSSPVQTPPKKAPPKRLNLQESNTALKPRRKPTTTANIPTSPIAASTSPKSKTIASLSKLTAALEAKLRSFGYSPTLLYSGLFPPAEMARLAELAYVQPLTPGLRRSPRLSPKVRAEAFLDKLSRQMVGGTNDVAVQTLVSPPLAGGQGAEASPDPEELEEFERVMMESPSPKGFGSPSRTAGSGLEDALLMSEVSEEE